MIVALIAMALNATVAIIMLAQSRRSARFAAIVALDIAKRALDHDETGVAIAQDLGMDDEEAEEELEWIALQRARLADVRPLIGLLKGKP